MMDLDDEILGKPKIDVREGCVLEAIDHLIELCGEDKTSFSADLTRQMIQTSLRTMLESHGIGQMKLMNRALKEMRYAYHIFNQYKGKRCISIFGSARTPEDHPDYQAAKAFSMHMADRGWMCLTGAANGIMKAGIEGAEKQASFGLSIKLPFESGANIVIEGDPKLIMFRYFFTRKLMFLSHSDAVAAFPGGVGTMDELFEVLTLMQTGKASIIPVVLIEGCGGAYWKKWEEYIEQGIMANGWMSRQDENFYYIAKDVEDALAHIFCFYKRYHSSRYVKDDLVIRLLEPLEDFQLQQLNEEFSSLVETGEIVQGKALPGETDYLELPRLIFHHTRKNFGILRALIDKINSY